MVSKDKPFRYFDEQEKLREEKIAEKKYLEKNKTALQLLNELKATILKEFRLKTILVPLPILKKAMFSITGNQQFNKWSYDPTKDDEIFRFITIEQIDELLKFLDNSP